MPEKTGSYDNFDYYLPDKQDKRYELLIVAKSGASGAE